MSIYNTLPVKNKPPVHHQLLAKEEGTVHTSTFFQSLNCVSYPILSHLIRFLSLPKPKAQVTTIARKALFLPHLIAAHLFDPTTTGTYTNESSDGLGSRVERESEEGYWDS